MGKEWTATVDQEWGDTNEERGTFPSTPFCKAPSQSQSYSHVSLTSKINNYNQMECGEPKMGHK